MRLAVWAVGATLAVTVAQGLTLGRVELTFDEAYYAMWARWPQGGYFDHPPLVAWMIGGSTALFGNGEFGVRALFWLVGALVPAMIGWLGWRLYEDARTAAAAVLFFVGAPLFAGSALATPDTPLVFFWTLALVGLVEVWRGREPAWALVGLAAGAAGLAKMTAGFLALGVALALLATPSLRGRLARPGPWGAAALALGVLSPFLFWNATHGFATFLKQGGRLAANGFAPRFLVEFVGSQLLLFNPLTAAAALWAARRGGALSEPTRLLVASIAPALAYFLIHALHDRVQGNWPAPLYPAFALLAARAAGQGAAPLVSAALGGGLILAAYLHLATAWPDFGPGDPALRIGGWRALAERVSGIAQARGAAFVIAPGYAATALLSFYGPQTVEAGEPERWTFRPKIATGGEGLGFGPPSFAAELAQRYPRVTPLATLRRRVGAVELEPYVVFAVEGAPP